MKMLQGAAALALMALPMVASAQYPAGQNYSPNVQLVAHVPLAGALQVSDIELEQELSRPYAYISRGPDPIGFDILSVKDPTKAHRIYFWSIENAEVHLGRGVNGKYFKLKARYYYVQALQIRPGSPNRDVSAVVFDVTGLPDPSTVKEVGRIKVPAAPGGAHNLFTYRHSDGRVMLFLTVEAPASHSYGAHIYDMEKFLSGAPDYGFVAGVPLPEPRGLPRGYHDVYVAYDPVSKQDRFYGGGPPSSLLGGDFVYDLTDPGNPRLLASIIAQASMQAGGHTFVATPDGRYGLTIMNSLGHQPVRFWDLKPALDGTSPVIRQPIGEWTVAPTKSGHMIEIRWPHAFIADYEQGLRVLDIRNPSDPVQVGFYDTYNYRTPYGVGTEASGGYGVDVRNADGLIVMADMHSGFWAFRFEGFDGWNGHDWGMPNSSSVQDWDNGPEGAPKPVKVS